MKLLSALKKGKWVRRKSWAEYYDINFAFRWYRRMGYFLVDGEGYKYEIDFSDLEATDWECKK